MPQLIIGLGNPGGEYARTRHNVGWMCLDELERRGKFGRERREGSARVREGTIDGYDVVTARPQTFMNLSGKAAALLTSKLGSAPRDTIVVHDEADFPLGRVKIKLGGSAAGHRGVQSLIDSWRTDAFPRIRIGVGRDGDSNDLIEHVLDPFTPDERPQVEAALTRAANMAVAITRDGLEAAMNTWNRAATD
ncbi:MAG TPA: aminoacyl-tRNA hydrolase [Candidatus Acidoferrales bacterium]|nr:aminoacyl-tRNA hydrolase [Candidatus Acidoferrales bacterium]